MKNQIFRVCLLTIALVLGLTSCEEEENLQEEGNWTLSDPVITAPTSSINFLLDETTPNETITFEWEPSVSSAGYAVTYEVKLSMDAENFEDALLSREASNNGSATSLSLPYDAIDEALSFAGIAADSEAEIFFAIEANSLSKSSVASSSMQVKRFENESIPNRLFISGTATENEDDLSQAIELKRLPDANGVLSNIHEIYTSLAQGEIFKIYSERSLPALQYGGEDGLLTSFGESITVPTDGQYRVLVNLDENTYDLQPINYWSMVGTPVNGGWGGDEPLSYEGNSIWRASISLINTGSFAFRANGDWGILLKQNTNSTGSLILESYANDIGLSVEDLNNDNNIGNYFVTLDLSSDGYSYSFEQDDTVVTPIATPSQLFLFEDGVMIKEFERNGDVFSYDGFLPLQSSNTYTLNSQQDGSGNSYYVNGMIASSVNPDADRVSDVYTMVEGNGSLALQSDRALNLSLDFSQPELTWTYYNFKLFHWDDWDGRTETTMTYSHPNTYSITANLNAGYNSKFISPWDYDLGSVDPTSLIGDLSTSEGMDINNINTDGTYDVTIILDDDYQAGTYQFN